MRSAFNKIALSAAVILSFVIYVFRDKIGDDEDRRTLPTTSSTNTPLQNTNTSTVTNVPTGKYRDGRYTGRVADAFYGNLQVAVTVANGKISDVQFLQYPNDRENSIFINQQAIPLLKQEAIQAQSAEVDGVSGATASSQAFVQSLQSALDQAT